MAGAPFGFPAPSGPYAGLRRSVIDEVTGQPVVTSPPTGRIHERAPLAPVGIDDSGRMVPAVPGFIADAPQTIASAVTLPRDVWRGEVETMPTRMSREEGQRVADLAGLAMTGSLPFRAPKGALRMFGGAAKEADDPFAALEAALAQGVKDVVPETRRAPIRLDPNAPSWDLYHGTGPSPDFQRFDPQVTGNAAERGAVFFAPDPETANAYTTTGGGAGEAGSRVFRASVEPGRTKVFDLGQLAETDPAFNARAREAWLANMADGKGGELFDDYLSGLRSRRESDRAHNAQLAEMGYAPGPVEGVNYGFGHVGAAVRQAQAEGLDTAIIRGLAEHGGDDQVIALTPGRVRNRYDGSLLYSGGPAGLGLGAAALASPSDAQAAPSQGTPPVTASPFGLGASAMRPEDLARLFRAAPTDETAAPIPTLPPRAGLGFGGAPMPSSVAPADLGPGRLPGSVPVAMDEAETQRLERATGMVPPARPVRVPLPPARPPEFSAPSQADLPAEGATPIMAAPQAGPAAPPAGEEPGFLDSLMGGIRKTDGLLTSLGIGLMTQRGFGPAVAAGLQHHQTAQRSRVATDLAQAELALKHRKLAQETGALQGNAAIVKRAFPNLSDAEALSAGSNSSLVTEALKIVRDPNHGRETQLDAGGVRRWTDTGQPLFTGDAARPDFVQATAPDGTVFVYDKANPTNRQTIASGSPARPATSEERQAFGIPGDAPVKMTAKDGPVAIGGGNTAITVGTPEKEQDKILGKGYGELQLKYAEQGRNAGSTLNTLALMEQAMKSPGFYSGVGGEGIKRMNQFLGALGVKDSRAASPAEVFDALSNRVVLDGLGGSLGPGISNTDRDYISRTAPTLAQSEQGNKDLIGIARSLAQRQKDVAQLARDYAARNGGRIDGGFDQALDEYAKANPLFPTAQGGASASAPQEPPRGFPQGARQARDGKWYAPDPTRPGKYLEIR